MGCVKWAVWVWFGQLFINLFPSSLRGGERRGLRWSCSSLVDLPLENVSSSLAAGEMDCFFSYSASCYPRKAGKKFFPGLFLAM
jgi:hypothetical protein